MQDIDCEKSIISGSKYASNNVEKKIFFKNLIVSANSGLKIKSNGDLKVRGFLGGSVYAEAKNIDVSGSYV